MLILRSIKFMPMKPVANLVVNEGVFVNFRTNPNSISISSFICAKCPVQNPSSFTLQLIFCFWKLGLQLYKTHYAGEIDFIFSSNEIDVENTLNVLGWSTASLLLTAHRAMSVSMNSRMFILIWKNWFCRTTEKFCKRGNESIAQWRWWLNANKIGENWKGDQ